MKVVRKFVTSFKLTRPNGDAAQTGDTVRLYLDIVANPTFPETLDATIVYPVTKTNCCGYSYSFEYDYSSVIQVCDILDVQVLDCCVLLEERVEVLENSITYNHTKLLSEYPRFIPIRHFLNSWSQYPNNEECVVYSDGQSIFFHGLLQREGFHLDNDSIYTTPNGFSPILGQDSRCPSAVNEIDVGYGTVGLTYSYNNPVLLGRGTGGSIRISFALNKASYPNKGSVLGAFGWSENDDVVTVLASKQISDAPIKLVIFTHGAGDDHISHISSPNNITDATQIRMSGIVNTLADEGYWTLSLNGGPIITNWGNEDSFQSLKAAIQKLKSLVKIDSIKIIGLSMGGLSGLRSMSDIPEISHFYGIYPVCNRQYMYENTAFSTDMTVADGGTFDNNSVSKDPMLIETSKFSGKKYRFVAGPDDTVVNTAANTDAFISKVSGIATVSKLTISGNHGTPNAFIPSDVISFFNS